MLSSIEMHELYKSMNPATTNWMILPRYSSVSNIKDVLRHKYLLCMKLGCTLKILIKNKYNSFKRIDTLNIQLYSTSEIFRLNIIFIDSKLYFCFEKWKHNSICNDIYNCTIMKIHGPTSYRYLYFGIA